MSELTNERLKEIASGQNTVSIPEAVEVARELLTYRESYRPTIYDQGDTGASVGYAAAAAMDFLKHTESLRSLRDAGDEGVERLFPSIPEPTPKDHELLLTLETEYSVADRCSSGSREAKLIRLLAQKIQVKESQFPELFGTQTALVTARQQLREAQEEIERLKGEYASLESNWLHEKENVEWQKTKVRNLRMAADAAGRVDLQSQIATLTAELAALKSCPAMAEVDALRLEIFEWLRVVKRNLPPSQRLEVDSRELTDSIGRLDAFARRSIASREEVVGLLKWFRRSVNSDGFMDEVHEWTPEAIRITEIVEGE